MFLILKWLCKKLAVQKKSGFTLIEVIVYTAIFAVTAGFLVGTLMTALKVQTRQSSLNALDRQISFINNTIQRLVMESDSISTSSMLVGVTLNRLTLNMNDLTLNPTEIFSSGTEAIYIKQGINVAIALTNSDTRVDSFTVTRYQQSAQLWEVNPPSLVQINFSLTINYNNPQARATRTFRTAVINCAKQNPTLQYCW